MEILGIGASELIFIFIIALIVLGPKDMQKAGRTVGRWLNQLIRSDGWKAFQQTSRELRNLPNRLMREANNEMLAVEKDLQKSMTSQSSAFAKPPAAPQTPNRSLPQRPEAENSIQPPSVSAQESNAEDGVGSETEKTESNQPDQNA